MGDGVALHQRAVARNVKRATGDFDRCVRQRQGRVWFIHQPQQVMVLGFGGELGEVLLADGQKHPCGRIWQRVNGSVDTVHMQPVVAFARLPGRTFKGTKRHPRRGAGLHCVGAHLGCEGMGGVDHMGDVFGLQVGRKPLGTTKTADARRQRLADGLGRAARVGKHRIQTRLGQGLGQRRGFGCAAQQEDACHV